MRAFDKVVGFHVRYVVAQLTGFELGS